ncbi:hypothetical protein CDIK_0967 [Cucumispora dikerogammari]|nr:hypothetical protein CDIK_0967 [Cucumispora dikerogammari]
MMFFASVIMNISSQPIEPIIYQQPIIYIPEFDSQGLLYQQAAGKALIPLSFDYQNLAIEFIIKFNRYPDNIHKVDINLYIVPFKYKKDISVQGMVDKSDLKRLELISPNEYKRVFKIGFEWFNIISNSLTNPTCFIVYFKTVDSLFLKTEKDVIEAIQKLRQVFRIEGDKIDNTAFVFYVLMTVEYSGSDVKQNFKLYTKPFRFNCQGSNNRIRLDYIEKT